MQNKLNMSYHDRNNKILKKEQNYIQILINYKWYYWFSRGEGDGDEICGDSRFFVFLTSKSKFLLA